MEDLALQAEIREKLKNLRINQGLSQRELSDRMGMAQGNFYRLEAGHSDVRFVTLSAWARALGYSLDVKFTSIEDDDSFDTALREVFGGLQ